MKHDWILDIDTNSVDSSGNKMTDEAISSLIETAAGVPVTINGNLHNPIGRVLGAEEVTDNGIGLPKADGKRFIKLDMELVDDWLNENPDVGYNYEIRKFGDNDGIREIQDVRLISVSLIG